MDFEHDLNRLAETYAEQGYQIVVHPKPEDLPDFAQDFVVEIVGRRVARGVIVSVKKNLLDLRADPNLTRYAEVIATHKGWRYDLATLEATPPEWRALLDAEELTYDGINQTLYEAEQIARLGLIRPALLTAWSALEAVLRKRLRATGEQANWESKAQSMITELYSIDIISLEDFDHLKSLALVRTQIEHGFAAVEFDVEAVEFLTSLARRLVEESQPAKQPALTASSHP